MARTSLPDPFDRNWLGRPETQWAIYSLVAMGFVAAMVTGRWRSAPAESSSPEIPALSGARHRINPNGAEWQDLAALTGLGKTLAKRIVAYRQAQRALLSNPTAQVFRCPQDLQAVKGIGTKRAAALGRQLVFSDASR